MVAIFKTLQSFEYLFGVVCFHASNNSKIATAARATEVPGPKIAATPDLYRKS
jgi:hypothetical protein